MTIRFLKPWNGYQPDAVVSGLTNESALIAGGLASYDLDGGNDGRTYEAKLATDANGNVTGLVGPDGERVLGFVDPDTPILILGGDHPYLQWYGTNGSNGMAQMYADQGIKPYIAINTDRFDYDEDPTNVMSYAQMIALQDRVEIVGHGHRHPQDWRLVNTGIVVRYTGAAATATVAITATNITGATAGAVDDFNFDITTAPYDTIAEVVAAIDALPNWTASYASELKGTEASTKLLLRSATTAKAADLYLAAGGGILITNTGTTYRSLTVNFNGTVLAIYGDGVRLLNLTIAGNTLAQVVTAINAVTGITAELTNDNEASAYRYCDGGEDAACLAAYKWTGRAPVGPSGVYLHAGLSHWYIVERQLVKCKEVAAANGIEIQNFAQSGDKFHPREMEGHSSYRLYRGNNKTGSVIYPNAFIRRGNFIPHAGVSQTIYPTDATARYTALLNAIVDSPGFTTCLLMHQLRSDGTSGYVFPPGGSPSGWNADESEWYAFVQAIGAANRAGTLRVMSMDEYRRFAPIGHDVSNLLFNPKLHNSGESLRVAASDPGQIVPGWRLGTLAAATSAASIDTDGFLSATTSSSILALEQVVNLEPGVYEFSGRAESLAYTSGNGVLLTAKAATPDFFTTTGLMPTINVFNATYALRGPGELRLRFSVFPPQPVPATVISLNSQTYNLSTNKNIRLNIDNKGLTADIDCSAGAVSAAAVTAKEVAAAINAGMAAAAATYAAEYHTIAKAVNGKVVLTAPYISGDVTGTIYVADGTSAGARATIFGDECYGVAMLSDYSQFGGLPITLGFEQNMVGTAKVGAFCLRRIRS